MAKSSNMKQETERGLTIAIVDADFEKPVKEHAIMHAQQSSETIGTYERNWQIPIVNTLNMVHIPELIQTGQQRRRERRKQQRKNK